MLGLRGRWDGGAGAPKQKINGAATDRKNKEFLLRNHDDIRVEAKVAMMIDVPSSSLQFSQATCSCEIPSLHVATCRSSCKIYCIVK